MKHLHHVIPKHMGGSDDPSNLIELTIEEHAEAHKKLYEEHGHWQDKVAWLGLAKMVGKEQLIYMLLSEGKKGVPRSEETKRKIRESKALNPRKNSKDHNEKISKANKGKVVSEETKKKMRDAALARDYSYLKGNKNASSLKGKKKSKEHIDAVKKSLNSDEVKQRKTLTWSLKPTLVCPHCGIEGKGGNMKRYHFDNCKGKNDGRD